ncbi:MAG: SHOCT domain-containing protein [Rhodoglobus sp.]
MAFHAQGANGDLDFDGAMVTITPLDGRGNLVDGGKSYPLSSIGALDYQAPTGLRVGTVQFSVLGDLSIRRRDMNTISFTKKQRSEIDVVVEAIRAALAAQAGGSVSSPPSGATASTVGADILGQIEMVAALHSNGVLTDEEFAAKKASLLERL